MKGKSIHSMYMKCVNFDACENYGNAILSVIGHNDYDSYFLKSHFNVHLRVNKQTFIM